MHKYVSRKKTLLSSGSSKRVMRVSKPSDPLKMIVIQYIIYIPFLHNLETLYHFTKYSYIIIECICNHLMRFTVQTF